MNLASEPTFQATGCMDYLRTMIFPIPDQSRLKNSTPLLQRSTPGQTRSLVPIFFSNCDNLSVAHILSSGTSKCRHIMILLRFLFYTCAHHNIMLRAIHINSVDNNWADALSRSQVDKFLASCPMTSRHPTPVTPLPFPRFK